MPRPLLKHLLRFSLRTVLVIHLLVWAAGVHCAEATANESNGYQESSSLDAEIPLSGQASVCSIAWRPGGQCIAVGDDSGLVRILNPISGKEIWRRDAHPMEGIGNVAVAFARDSDSLIVNSPLRA